MTDSSEKKQETREVKPPRATRRHFSKEFKERIVREAAVASKTGQLGALLRREGVYSSSLVKWRREFEQGGPSALEAKRRGPKARYTQEEKQVQKLERENQRLRKRLEMTEALLDLQKKTLAMLETLDLKEESE
jgi:transposase